MIRQVYRRHLPRSRVCTHTSVINELISCLRKLYTCRPLLRAYFCAQGSSGMRKMTFSRVPPSLPLYPPRHSRKGHCVYRELLPSALARTFCEHVQPASCLRFLHFLFFSHAFRLLSPGRDFPHICGENFPKSRLAAAAGNGQDFPNLGGRLAPDLFLLPWTLVAVTLRSTMRIKPHNRNTSRRMMLLN